MGKIIFTLQTEMGRDKKDQSVFSSLTGVSRLGDRKTMINYDEPFDPQKIRVRWSYRTRRRDVQRGIRHVRRPELRKPDSQRSQERSGNVRLPTKKTSYLPDYF